MSYEVKYKDGNPLILKPWWHIPDNLSQCCSLKEACEIYHYSRSGLIKKIKRGDAQGFKMHGRWYVVKHSIFRR